VLLLWRRQILLPLHQLAQRSSHGAVRHHVEPLTTSSASLATGRKTATTNHCRQHVDLVIAIARLVIVANTQHSLIFKFIANAVHHAQIMKGTGKLLGRPLSSTTIKQPQHYDAGYTRAVEPRRYFCISMTAHQGKFGSYASNDVCLRKEQKELTPLDSIFWSGV